MCADNSMADQSYIDLREMMQAGSTADVNIIVQVDRPTWDSLPLPRRYRVVRNGLQLLGEMPELDMADPQNLIDFVRFGRDFYPADHYFLVLWDHGNGWTLDEANVKWQMSNGQCQMGGEENQEQLRQSTICTLQSVICNDSSPRHRSIFYDLSSNNEISVAGGELKQALDGVRSVLGRKVDVLDFDACLMGMLEVGYEVRAAAAFMVGSEDLTPFNGLPYDSVFNRLIRQPGIKPRDFAAAIPGLFVASYSGGSQGEEEALLSALDLAALDKAVPALEQWLAAADARELPPIRRAVQTFACEHIPANRFDDNIDLIHLLELSRNAGIAPALAEDALGELQAAVIASAGNDTVFTHANGIAAWFPDNYLALKYLHRAYAGLQFARDCPWLHFLNRCFGVDDVKPEPVLLSTTGSGNNLRLAWTSAFDLAPVGYDAYELQGVSTVFNDSAANPEHWETLGFRPAQHEGRIGYYSGLGDELDNTLTLCDPPALPDGGLLSFDAWYNTRETGDTIGNREHDVLYVELLTVAADWTALDSLYGSSDSWVTCRYVLPPGPDFALRFRFKTLDGPHVNGVYLANIVIQSCAQARRIAFDRRATTLDIFNSRAGDYRYVVTPKDSFGNRGPASNEAAAVVSARGLPYTVPAPLVTGDGRTGRIMLDVPGGEIADVRIYTLSGEMVRTFSDVTTSEIPWDGTNNHGRRLASGVYLVTVKYGTIIQRATIAVVHR